MAQPLYTPSPTLRVSVVNKDLSFKTLHQNTFKDRFKLRGAREHKTKKSN